MMVSAPGQLPYRSYGCLIAVAMIVVDMAAADSANDTAN
jgi:hypothetical protein